MSKTTIKIDDLSKVYRLYKRQSDRFIELVHPLRRKFHNDFYALKNIDLEIESGGRLGVVGRNGSGKSTLLKLITGVLHPTSGNVSVDGRVAALLELGTGFNPEMTGIENVYFHGLIHGWSREEMDDRLEDILAFADIGEYAHQMVKTYSSGMFVRLAFSAAINVDPDILIVDEALSVGDVFFQQKCIRRIEEFIKQQKTFIFVSHDAEGIKQLCDRAILLKKGEIAASGDPRVVMGEYRNEIIEEMHGGRKLELSGGSDDSISDTTTGQIKVLSFDLLNDAGESITITEAENHVTFVFEMEAIEDLHDPHFGIMIRNQLGVTIFESNTYCCGLKNSPLKAGEKVEVRFRFFVNWWTGDYSFTIGSANGGIGRDQFEEHLLLANDVAALKVLLNPNSIVYYGTTNINPEISVKKR